MSAELRFRAMGSDAHVIVVGGPRDLAGRAHARIADLEAKWSRFIDTSEVSALNRQAGRPVRVSADTALLVRRAVEATHLSGGSFDPLVLGAMLRAGYDRTFEQVARGGNSTSEDSFPVASATCDLAVATGNEGHASENQVSESQVSESRIHVDGSRVQIPRGRGFDPGGIGKGLAADLVVGEAMAAGATGVCVNLGGDVRVSGDSPDGGGWTIAIGHPQRHEPLALIGIRDGAVATSTTLLRTWHVDGDHRHHIIDPATSMPSDTDLTLVSVVSANGWTSEILAKAVLLRGSAHPFDLLGGTPADAIAVDRHGRVQATAGLQHFLGDIPLPRTLDLDLTALELT